MNRRLMFAALALMVAGAVVFFFLPPDPVSLQSYQRIRLGMSFEEVKGLIGEPGLYIDEETLAEDLVSRTGSLWVEREGDASEGFPRKLNGERTESWYGRVGEITITLDDNGLVVAKSFFRSARRSFLDRVVAGPRAWFGW